MGTTISNNKSIIVNVGQGNTGSPTTSVIPTTDISPNISSGLNPVLTSNDFNIDAYSSYVNDMLLCDEEEDMQEYMSKKYVESFENNDNEVINDEVEYTHEFERSKGNLMSLRPGTLQGAMSINTNLINEVSKMSNQIINVGSKLIGDESEEFSNVIEGIMPSVSNIVKGMWSQGLDGNVNMTNRLTMSAGNEYASNILHEDSQLNTILPPPTLTSTRGQLTLIEQDRGLGDFLKSALSTTINKFKEVIVKGKGPMRVISALLSNGSEDPRVKVPISNADAMLSESKSLPADIVMPAMHNLIKTGTNAERYNEESSGAMIALTGSSPGLTYKPTKSMSEQIFSKLSNTAKEIVGKIVSVAGNQFGLNVSLDGSREQSDVNSEAPLNAITPLINNIRVDRPSDKKVITVEDVNNNKDVYRSDMKTPLEMLICPPNSIPYSSLPDALWEHEKPMTEVFNSISTKWLEEEAYDQESFLTQFHSIGLFKTPIDIQVIGQGSDLYDSKMVFALPHICDIDSVYSDYDITANFVMSMIALKKADVGTPCIFFVPKGGNKTMALTSVVEKGTDSVFRATINTSLCAKAKLYGGDGYFGFGVRSSKPFTGKVTLEVKGSCTLIKNTITPNVNYWIYNREKTNSAILQHVCSISLVTLSSSSSADVTTLWSYLMKNVVSSIIDVINVLENTPSFLPAYEALGQILVERLVTDEGKEKMTDINNVKAWVKYALMRMPTWLNYEVSNPFYQVKYDFRPQLAWRVLTMWYGARKVSVYTTSNKSIIKGAYPVLETYASPNSLAISTPNVPAMLMNKDLKKVERSKIVKYAGMSLEESVYSDILVPYFPSTN